MDPYNDSDPAFAATPLESPTAIPTFQNCPQVRFQQPGRGQLHSNHQQGYGNQQRPPFQFGSNAQGPLRYDPRHGLQPQGYPPQGGHPSNPYQQHNQQQQHQLIRPLVPPIEFLDQHLDVFQATTYGVSDSSFKIESGPPEAIDLDLFCLKGIVDTLVESKRKLREVPPEIFSRARQRCNPYELVGSSVFMNRASVKLASIDSQLALTATKEDPTILTTVTENQNETDAKTFRFADLCSGPGGFSEYLLWRKHTWGERARGWAMTLKGELDFTLDRFHRDTAVSETLKVFYGADDTGNILKTENIQAFADLVESDTGGLGVGLVSADGGISVDGDEAVQETLLQRLILCQIVTMFMTLQKGGDFVVKIFDIFTPVTAGLVWILSRKFEKICVVKPLTSRPMNSERYVVCRHLLERKPASLIDHLLQVNAEYQSLEDKAAEAKADPEKATTASDSAPKDAIVNHLVDLEVLKSDEHFMEYIKRNNMKTAIRQTEALDVFLKYVNEGLRPAFDQEAIKKLCLQEWHIPPRPIGHPLHTQHQQQHQQHQQRHPHHPQQHPNQHQQQRYPPHQAHHHQQQHRSGPPPGYHPYQQQPQRSVHPHHQGSSSRPRPPSSHSYNHQQPQHQQYPQGPSGQRRPSSGNRPGSNQAPGLLDSLLNNMQQPPRH